MDSIDSIILELSTLRQSIFVDFMIAQGMESTLMRLKRELTDILGSLKHVRHEAAQLEILYE